MSTSPLISVIVPVYKVEPYLDRCVQSIIDQTYSNLEIILVDDGSPDNCPAMCDAWAEKGPRIKVIHKDNGGLSDARNAGMEVASGELIGFIDSDDWIEPNMYQLLYDNMQRNNADISVCGVEMNWEGNLPPHMLTCKGNCVLSTEDAMRAIIEESWLKQPVWYKLYKTDQIKNIPFAVGKYHEDVFWSYQAIAKARRISVCDTPCYHYIQRGNSIMGTSFSLKRLDALEAQENRLQYLSVHFPSLVSTAKIQLLQFCMYLEQMALRSLTPSDFSVANQRITSLLNAYPLNQNDNSLLSLKQKIWLYLLQHFPIKTSKIRNILNIGI